MYTVIKRDGKEVNFDLSKIRNAITKAFDACEMNYHPDTVDFLALKVTSDFEQKIADDYAWLSEALDGCWGQPITGHERLAEGVVRTTYAGGTRILINYNRFDVTLADGRTIPAQQYISERS